MLDRVLPLLSGECGLVKDRPVLAGVSGGPDSLCLLDILQQAGYPVIVAHLDHGLRPESAADLQAVEALARARGLPFVGRREDVDAFARRETLSVEEAARILRYRFLFKAAREGKAQAVVVGHTADDQVETILMHFLRGAGLSGLKGMTPRSFLPEFDPDIPLVRPLLDLWREDTLVHCAGAGLQPLHDPSNASLTYFRNRLRHVLIPALEKYNPRLREAVWRTGKALRGDHAIVQETVDRSWDETFADSGDGWLALHAGSLTGLPPAVLRNLARRALESLSPGMRDIDFDTLDRAAAFFSSADMRSLDLPGGMRLLREGRLVLLAARGASLPGRDWPQLAEPGAVLDLPVPGEVELPDGWRLMAERWTVPGLAWEKARANDDPYQGWLDGAGTGKVLQVRARRPGDRFQPLGMADGSLKLSDFFINVKLARRARDAWPLVCAGDEIIWVPGLRLSDPRRLREDSRNVLFLALLKK